MPPGSLWHHLGPLIYYFKPNTFSKKKKKNPVHLGQLFYSRDRGYYTQPRSGVWKSWASLKELGMKKIKKAHPSEWGQPTQLEKAAHCGGLPKDHWASVPDPGPNHCISSAVLEGMKKKKKNQDMFSALFRGPEHAFNSRNLCSSLQMENIIHENKLDYWNMCLVTQPCNLGLGGAMPRANLWPFSRDPSVPLNS